MSDYDLRDGLKPQPYDQALPFEIPPDELTLADGTTVPHRLGQRVFNYYDMVPGTITRLATRSEPDTSGRLPEGKAWWVEVDGTPLDGSRLCSIQFARRKGWL
jgi:hypothetical protein